MSEVNLSEWGSLGIVGAGVMGAALAQLACQHGLAVVLVDINGRRLEEARAEITRGLRAARLRGLPVLGGTEAALARVKTSEALRDLDSVRLVIENVYERWAVKEEVYRGLDRVCQPTAILAANTSCCSITRLGQFTNRTQRVLGLHFMNPAVSKPLVEVIRGEHTSTETLEVAFSLLRHLGKEGVVVNDRPGFVSNRVLMLTVNEAIRVVSEEVATVEDVDRIFRSCFGHPMGPLETADLIGLDTVLDSLEILRESLADSRFEPSLRLREMVATGLLGRKSGQGFYDHGGQA